MAKGIRSNLIETEVKAQVVAAIQKVTTSMQTMMKSMEAQIDKLRKEMVWNRSMGVARQQRLPQEVVHLNQDVQNGANTRDSSHKDSPVLNPLHGHDDESIRAPCWDIQTPRINFLLMDQVREIGTANVTNFSSLHFMGRADHWYQSYQMTI